MKCKKAIEQSLTRISAVSPLSLGVAVVEPIVRALLIERHGLEARAARSGYSSSAARL